MKPTDLYSPITQVYIMKIGILLSISVLALLIPTIVSAIPVTEVCLNSTHGYAYSDYIIVEDGVEVSYRYNQTRYCKYDCDTANGVCSSGPAINIWVFAITSVIFIFLMFFRVDPILNITGSLGLIVIAGYVMIYGLDISNITNYFSSSGNSFIINNYITLLIGFIYFGLSIYRMASSWSRFGSEVGKNNVD